MRVDQQLHGGVLRANWLAIIKSGVVKITKAKADGRRQIVGLKFPSELLGLAFSFDSSIVVEAATEVTLCCFSESAFREASFDHPDIHKAVVGSLLDELDSARQWVFVLGQETAEARVASLLVLLARGASGTEPQRSSSAPSLEFAMPLSRSEMADCLGLRLETVSRQLAQLRSRRVIEITRARLIRILDIEALLAMTSGGCSA